MFTGVTEKLLAIWWSPSFVVVCWKGASLYNYSADFRVLISVGDIYTCPVHIQVSIRYIRYFYYGKLNIN